MRALLRFVAFLAGLGLATAAQAQQAYFPQTLPTNTIIGRLGAGIAGPAQAIPFTALANELNALGLFVGGPSSTSVGDFVLWNSTNGGLLSDAGSGAGTGVLTALAVNVGSAGSIIVNGGALGTPSSGTATNLTGLPLTSGVTGVLPIANGGTNCSSGSITCFNGITGYTASGATGTTSTNLVFSTSPTLVTPALGVATATSLNGLTVTTTTGTLTIANSKTLTDTSGVGASLLLGATGGGFAAYGGVTCTNQFLNALSAAGAGTCASVVNAYLTAGTFSNITGTGTLTAGATGSGFTVALGSSTVTGQLAIANGGTGAAISATQYGLPYFSSTTVMGSTGAGATSTVLQGNASGAPTWVATLPSTVQGNITSTGALASGTIASGFGTIVTSNTISTTANTITSASANALAAGLNGATNPAFNVNASTASQAAGLNVTGAATGGTVAIATIDSGSNTNLTINAKGTGTIGIGSISTGAVTITPATTITGALTLSTPATVAQIYAGTAGIALDSGNVFNSAGSLVALSGTTSVTPNFAAGFNFSFTATTADNYTLQNPSTMKVGQTGCIFLTQPASGTVVTIAFGADWYFAGGSAPTLTATLGAVDVLCYVVETTGIVLGTMINNIKA